MKLPKLTAAALVLSMLPSLSQAALDGTEQALITHIDTENPKARQLLKQAVNINSGSMNFDGVEQVYQLFKPQFQALGFDVKWIDGNPFGRAGHLVATRIGNNAKVKILMIGHLDTVFSKDSSVQKWVDIDANTVKGPGIIDMKGGDVIIISALKALAKVDKLDDFSIQVVMTGDEEKRGAPMEVAAKVLVDSAKWADIALGFENGDSDPKTAVISRRGYTGWQLSVKGKPMHSSQIFREDIGYGAIYETARILDGFRTSLSAEPNLTFNPGLIVGGTEATLNTGSARANAYGKQNVIAKTARVSGDLRALSIEQQEKAKAAMTKIVAANLPHTSATITFEPGYPPMAPTQGNRALLALYDEVSRDLGQGSVTAVDPRRAGAADISFTAGYVEMAMDGLGLMGHSAHTDDETADMRTLPSQTKRTALLMYRLLKARQ